MTFRILPNIVDNTYRGNKIALWFFYLITIVTFVRSCIHIFRYDGGAQSIATIPLDTFTESGAAAVIFIFAYWGLSQLVTGLVYLLVLLKYRSLIPLMYLLFLFEYIGRLGISYWKPIETVGQAPGGVANYAFIPLGTILLYLSLSKKATT